MRICLDMKEFMWFIFSGFFKVSATFFKYYWWIREKTFKILWNLRWKYL